MNLDNSHKSSEQLTPSGRRAAAVMALGGALMLGGAGVWAAEALEVNGRQLPETVLIDVVESGLLLGGSAIMLAGQRMLIRSRDEYRTETNKTS